MKSEAELYAPVKAFLETQGYVVKAEIKGCDVVGVRGDEPPVIVELKLGFGLGLLHQGIDRLDLSDIVYLAVAIWPRRLSETRKLCRRLGLGLMIVARGRVEIVLDPVPYSPRRNKRRSALLLGEHARRIGDPNRGGITRMPIMTAYRQEALRCATLLEANGATKIATLRVQGDVPKAARILQDDVYGWFQRVERGVYTLSPKGLEALSRFGRMAAA